MVNPITMTNIQHNFYIQFHLDISLLYHHEIVLIRRGSLDIIFTNAATHALTSLQTLWPRYAQTSLHTLRPCYKLFQMCPGRKFQILYGQTLMNMLQSRCTTSEILIFFHKNLKKSGGIEFFFFEISYFFNEIWKNSETYFDKNLKKSE